MKEYARTEQQQYSNQPYNTYNNQLNQNWENNNMPAQDMQSYEQASASTSAAQARNWNGTSYAQNTYQTNGQNGICGDYLLKFLKYCTHLFTVALIFYCYFSSIFCRDIAWLRCVSIRTTFDEPRQRTSKHSKWHIS